MVIWHQIKLEIKNRRQAKNLRTYGWQTTVKSEIKIGDLQKKQ